MVSPVGACVSHNTSPFANYLNALLINKSESSTWSFREICFWICRDQVQKKKKIHLSELRLFVSVPWIKHFFALRDFKHKYRGKSQIWCTTTNTYSGTITMGPAQTNIVEFIIEHRSSYYISSYLVGSPHSLHTNRTKHRTTVKHNCITKKGWTKNWPNSTDHIQEGLNAVDLSVAVKRDKNLPVWSKKAQILTICR